MLLTCLFRLYGTSSIFAESAPIETITPIMKNPQKIENQTIIRLKSLSEIELSAYF